jgi:plastocyanin
MTKMDFKTSTRIIYFLFLIILVNYCSDSQNKAIASGHGNKYALFTAFDNKPRVFTVTMSDMKFQPEIIHVSKGDTVIWKNNDMVAHTVARFPDKKWSSPVIPSGGSWKLAITESSDYYCTIHPEMKGKIIVN